VVALGPDVTRFKHRGPGDEPGIAWCRCRLGNEAGRELAILISARHEPRGAAVFRAPTHRLSRALQRGPADGGPPGADFTAAGPGASAFVRSGDPASPNARPESSRPRAPKKRRPACKGADHAIDVPGWLPRQVMERTGGRGVDIITTAVNVRPFEEIAACLAGASRPIWAFSDGRAGARPAPTTS